jgi:Holliday junction resolvase RusA-like endonuclease
MPKTRHTISCTLPAYINNRDKKYTWRRQLLAAVRRAASAAGVERDPDAEIEVSVQLYLKRGKGHDSRDVDNLLKHVLDASGPIRRRQVRPGQAPVDCQ